MMTEDEIAKLSAQVKVERLAGVFGPATSTFLDEVARHQQRTEKEIERLRGEAEMLRMMRDADCTKLNEYIDKTREAEAEIVLLRAEAQQAFTRGREAGCDAMLGPMQDQRKIGADEERAGCLTACHEIARSYEQGPEHLRSMGVAAATACSDVIRARMFAAPPARPAWAEIAERAQTKQTAVESTRSAAIDAATKAVRL